MRLLLTGSEGNIGRWLTPALEAAGHHVTTLDASASDRPGHIVLTLPDFDGVSRAVAGMDGVVHAAAIPGDSGGTPQAIHATNVLGTLQLLEACERAGTGRFVFFSSVQALGNFAGHRSASILPIADDYPAHPMTAYQLSKQLGELACACYTRRTGIVTHCFRPVAVLQPNRGRVRSLEEDAATSHGWWRDYWAWVDVRDVCSAVTLSLANQTVSHGAWLLASSRSGMNEPTAELVDSVYPKTPWSIDRAEWLRYDDHRGLVDCSAAARDLGWRPEHPW
ncbi:MAG: NAD(P)-dependent oxidoreductase [Armatimonadetes bacterium]|nr:NAD(P)-dependent oxidoreductase [Armatimonadota bacterium]MDE2207820.1 NAD(P)-dependent oxidoreductase [Armatimonadota bacterium]